MQKTILVATLLICFNAHSNDCEVVTPATESVSEYLLKMAESLTVIKIYSQKLEDVRIKKDDDATDAMVALKELKTAYRCASSKVGSYKKSKNKGISESSGALSQSYQNLAVVVDEMIADIKVKLDGKEEISAGEQADRDSDRMLDVKKKWEQVIASLAEGTSAAVDVVNPKTNKTDKLLISKSERDLVVKELKTQFKLPMKKGDESAIDEVANLYYGFLTQQWKFK